MNRLSLRIMAWVAAGLACCFMVFLYGCALGSSEGDGGSRRTGAAAAPGGQRAETPAGSSLSTPIAHGEGTEFRALLSGSERIPPVDSQASGSLVILVNERTGEIEFELRLTGISGVTGAYINRAPAGENGPPIVPLFTGPPTGDDFSGVLTRGKLTSEGFMASLRNKPTAALVEALKSGETYCTVQTERWPLGELRGQIR